MGRPSPECTAEFKRRAAGLYRERGCAYAGLAREPGCDAGGISDWVERAGAAGAAPDRDPFQMAGASARRAGAWPASCATTAGQRQGDALYVPLGTQGVEHASMAARKSPEHVAGVGTSPLPSISPSVIAAYLMAVPPTSNTASLMSLSTLMRLPRGARSRRGGAKSNLCVHPSRCARSGACGGGMHV